MNGTFLCDECAQVTEMSASIPKPKRKHGVDPTRRMGCIVTVRDEDGRTYPIYRPGKTREVLREICAEIPEGACVLTISTWRTILRDIKAAPRKRGPGEDIDPYSVERTLLSQIGRLDRLPPEADIAYDHDPVKVAKANARRGR